MQTLKSMMAAKGGNTAEAMITNVAKLLGLCPNVKSGVKLRLTDERNPIEEAITDFLHELCDLGVLSIDNDLNYVWDNPEDKYWTTYLVAKSAGCADDTAHMLDAGLVAREHLFQGKDTGQMYAVFDAVVPSKAPRAKVPMEPVSDLFKEVGVE